MIHGADPGPVEDIIDGVLAHVQAEFTSDPEVIAGTISADAFFPVLVNTLPTEQSARRAMARMVASS